MKPLLAATFAIAVLTALASAVVPEPASAGLASITSRTVAIREGRAAAAAAPRFELVGLRWRGSGSVRFSVRSTSGRWSAWLDGAAEEEDQPDRGTRESGATRGWRVGNPTWVGASTAIRYRLAGRVTTLHTSFVRSPELRIPLRAVAVAGAPAIVPRSTWGADETIRKGDPTYAPAIRFASVHHTAGPNDYSPAQAAAIMRGIQIYHVKSNGWNDIGYNFLVDRYGTVYEGRYGGIDRNVVGAHIRGFNTGSVGVAVIGTFGTATVPPVAEASLQSLLAWRLDLAHVDPRATVTVVSAGSERYPAGTQVPLRAISAHRDTGLTSCPGDILYGRLPGIAVRAQSIGLPKIYEPTVTGAIGGIVRLRGRVSSALPWRVVVSDGLGQQLGSGTGTGPAVDWSWDASLAVVTGARWRIEVGGATPASGTLGKVTPAGPLAITGLAASPAAISPNGDGAADSSTITYTTTASATVEATLLTADGTVAGTIAPPARQPAGVHTVTFDGLGQPDGVYAVLITATDAAGVVVARQVQVAVTRTLLGVTVAPAVLTPNGDGKGDTLFVRFDLTAPATVRIRVLREGAWVATMFSGTLSAGSQSLRWDGTKRVGKARDGSYSAVVEATDSVATSAIALPFLLDAHPPAIKLLRNPARLWLSEAATVTVRVNGSLRRLVAKGPGTLALSGIRTIRSLVAVARDAAGNRTVLRHP